MEVFKIFATLGLNSDEFNKGIDGAQKKVKDIGKSVTEAGTKMSAAVTAPIVGFGLASLKAGGDFQAAMNQVAAVSGATQTQFDALSETAKRLGSETQFSASQAAEAMSFMAMAGMDADTIVASMADTLNLAAAAQLDMGSAADIVTNIMAGFNLESSELAGAVDVLAKAFTSSNTDLVSLAEAMKYAGPIAASAGVSFEETAAAIGLMGNAGIQGSMAGTSLRGAITRLLTPTNQVSKALEELGVEVLTSDGRLKSLVDIIAQLEPHAEDTGAFMTIFGQRAGPAMAALVSQGSDALRTLIDDLDNSGGTAQRIAETQMKGLNGALKTLESAFEALMIAVAESGILDFVTDMVTQLADFIRGLSKTNPEMLRMATIIGAIVAAIGPALIIFGQLTKAIGFAMGGLKIFGPFLGVLKLGFLALGGPIGILIAALSAFVAYVALDFKFLQGYVGSAWDYILLIFNSSGDKIKGFGPKLGEIVKGLKDRVIENLAKIFPGIESVSDGVVAFFSSMLGRITKELGVLPVVLSVLFKGIAERFANFKQVFVSGLDDLPDNLSTIMGLVLGKLGELGRFALDAIVGTFQKVSSMIQPHIPEILAILSKVWETLKEIGLRAFNAIWEAIKKVPGLIEPHVPAILSTLQKMWDKLKEFGLWAASSIWEAIKKLPSQIEPHIPQILATLQTVWDKLVELGKWAGGKVIEAIKALPGLIAPHIPMILATLSTIWDKLVEAGSWVGKKLVAFIVSIPSLIEPHVPAILNVLQLILEKTGEFIIWAGKKIFEFIVSIPELIKPHVPKILEVLKFIGDKVVEFGIWLGGKIVEVVQKLPQAMEPIIKAVLDKMRDLREGMIQALANLRDRFVDFGKNLVQGLIDGIQSMISKLGETISGIAGEVANRFKRVLGIQSPSRVFFEFGKNISEGLNNGIQSIPTVPVGIEGIVNAGGINQNLMGMASPSASQAGFNPQLLNSFLEQQSAMFEKFNRSVRIFDEVANKQTVASMRY